MVTKARPFNTLVARKWAVVMNGGIRYEFCELHINHDCMVLIQTNFRKSEFLVGKQPLPLMEVFQSIWFNNRVLLLIWISISLSFSETSDQIFFRVQNTIMTGFKVQFCQVLGQVDNQVSK